MQVLPNPGRHLITIMMMKIFDGFFDCINLIKIFKNLTKNLKILDKELENT